MKNEHIENLLIPVPRSIGLEVYKELLERIETNNAFGFLKRVRENNFYLCLCLPEVLWDRSSPSDPCPDGSEWRISQVSLGFPELNYWAIRSIECIYVYRYKNAKRGDLLRSWIKKLENNE